MKWSRWLRAQVRIWIVRSLGPGEGFGTVFRERLGGNC
jgi:hypothetical protein